MLVFIDESGDLGFNFKKGSSKTFVLLAVVFETNSAAIYADNLIKEIKLKLNKKEAFEFHFSKNSKKVKEAFLSEINDMNFSWYAISIQKELLYSSNMQRSEFLLSKVVEYLCNNLNRELVNAKIVLDTSKGKEFYKKLQSDLKKYFNQNGNKKIRKIRAEDSERNNLLQLADYCCAVVDGYLKKNSKKAGYYDFIKRKKGKNIQIWPNKNEP